MNVFVQGMRRSGTTILYDALLEDPGLRCFYEPFREEAETLGGGSGAREHDVFAETRELRRAFQAERHPEVALARFNLGGPGDPEREADPELPAWAAEWIAELLAQAPSVLIKFVRMYRKLPALASIDPRALLVHVTRDPRAVAGSMLYGRRRTHARYPDAEAFFGARTQRKLWSSRQIAEALLREPANASLGGDLSDLERVLLVWRAAVADARRDGISSFGDRYLMIRLEDLAANPAAQLGRIYAGLERPVPTGVVAWAERHVHPVTEPPFAGDPRWLEVSARLGLNEALEATGYADPLGGARRARR